MHWLMLRRAIRKTWVIGTICGPGLALLGCSGSGCPTLQECDIREESCQRDAVKVAACLRGSDPIDIRVEVREASALLQSARTTAEQEAEPAHVTDAYRALALVGLMPPAFDRSELAAIYSSTFSAYWDAEDQTITVVDDGRPLDGVSALAVLVHEIIHAMQNRDLGADYLERHAGTDDASLAVAAMLEGEAELYEDLAVLEGFARDPDDVDWDRVFSGARARTWERTRDSEYPYYLRYRDFPYSFGGAYINRAWRRGGNEAVRALFESPPLSTRQIMAGHGARPPSGLPWRELPEDVGTPVLPPEFELSTVVDLGAWLFEVFRDHAARSSNPRSFDAYADSGFAGDIFNVFRMPSTGDVALFWRVRFDSAEQAGDVLATLETDSGRAALQDGRDLIIVASTDPTVPDAVIPGLQWQPVTGAGLPLAQ